MCGIERLVMLIRFIGGVLFIGVIEILILVWCVVVIVVLSFLLWLCLLVVMIMCCIWLCGRSVMFIEMLVEGWIVLGEVVLI